MSLPVIASSSLCPEQRLWTERLLARLCVLTSLPLPASVAAKVSVATDLTAFRAWANFWDGRPAQGLVELEGPDADFKLMRRHIWKAYYSRLSVILQQGLLYDPPLEAIAEKTAYLPTARMLQRVELKRVETTYEGLLLKEIRFPKANEVNEEVEEWVELVMKNWRIFCGSSWHDEELGEGGQEAVGRNVLDVSQYALLSTSLS